MEPAPVHPLSTTSALRGFTIMEMVVVIAIITIISSIALLGQNTFNRSIILTNTAYTVAFSVREAQFLGISSRVFNGIQNAGYGIRFLNDTPHSYVLFADTVPVAAGNIQPVDICPGHRVGSGPEAKPGDCIQTQAAEIVRTYNLNNGFRVLSFCGREATGGTERCSGYLSALNIVYLRPNTQSIITGVRSGGVRVALSDATIRIASPDGLTERCVYVSKAGQVTVNVKGASNCP